ncbi:MAG: hypothetical protein ACE5HO_17025 [bacterium]
MKRDWDDVKIKQLFLDLRAEDESRAPSFQRIWAGATARLSNKKRARFGFRLAAAAALLAIISLSAFVLFETNERPVGAPPSELRGSIVAWQSVTLGLLNVPEQETPANTWQASVALSLYTVPSITRWQSPTAFSLSSPGQSTEQPVDKNQ